jgi:hypothetical protein
LQTSGAFLLQSATAALQEATASRRTGEQETPYFLDFGITPGENYIPRAI